MRSLTFCLHISLKNSHFSFFELCSCPFLFASEFAVTIQKFCIKERIIHDYIVNLVTYDEQVANSEQEYEDTIPMDFNLYGAALERSAVCEGYAKLFQYLCYNVGINCTVVEGDSNEFLHMWNAVCIDGEWYQIDVTWDDEENYISYDYFNLTTAEMDRDHISDGAVLKIPKCEADTNSFLNCFVVYEDGTDDAPESFKQELLTANKLPNKNIYIYIKNVRLNPLGEVDIKLYKSYMEKNIYSQTSDFMKFAIANNITVSTNYKAEGIFIVIQNN